MNYSCFPHVALSTFTAVCRGYESWYWARGVLVPGNECAILWHYTDVQNAPTAPAQLIPIRDEHS